MGGKKPPILLFMVLEKLMSKEMKLIMESWRKNIILKESVENPETWGELAQKIALARAAEKWPRLGKSLLRFGWKAVTGIAKQAMDSLEEMEELLDKIPDEWQEKIEQGTEEATEWMVNWAKTNGGAIGGFIVGDLMGMDDKISDKLPGFAQLNLEDEYENLLNKELLKKFAISVIRYAKQAPPDEKLPDLNSKLEQELQKQTGAHPDTDPEHVRGK
jgi:hypothetical protein